ncbi:hypothetical protein A4R44_03576 [Amycolatopsis sp. M39]|uniref:Excreted virulence factor EspC, type VII ESX diderm n=2 Tax=Amycolatopsis rubida TaxID=112413 RepID=A0A1I5L0R0_9PSEU|nr:hypothetical protein A4R44_03576 [Amycolatopsis sp. M39]SFO90934.1 hypothetical protein SAMN05421854_103403 [Amycolatopsis rubida]
MIPLTVCTVVCSETKSPDHGSTSEEVHPRMSEAEAERKAGLPGLSGGRFAVTPELATATYAKLGELQDVVGEMVREAAVLGRSVPLGGGYAGEVGAFMAKYGLGRDGSAVDQLTAFGKEIAGLKKRIGGALEKYRDQDGEAAEGVDCTGG